MDKTTAAVVSHNESVSFHRQITIFSRACGQRIQSVDNPNVTNSTESHPWNYTCVNNSVDNSTAVENGLEAQKATEHRRGPQWR